MSNKILEGKYYSLNKILSYNGVVNMIMGARGNGKSYAVKKYMLKRHIRFGEEFIYLRRYRNELMMRDTFLADVGMDPDIIKSGYDYRVKGYVIEVHKPGDVTSAGKPNYETVGYFKRLSGQQSMKSSSLPKVCTIMFDEFLIEKGKIYYLPEEPNMLMNLYNTVDRYNDRVKIFMCANNVMLDNPYFIYWDIRPDGREFYRLHDGFIILQMIKDEDFKDAVKQTRFGRFISETTYGQYAIEAFFADDNDFLIKEKPSDAVYYATIETSTGTFTAWKHDFTWYLSEKTVANPPIIYTTEIIKMREGCRFLDRNSKMLQYLRNSFGRGMVFFDSTKAKNGFIGVFKR